MAVKVCVNVTGPLAPGKAEAVQAKVAAALGVLIDDVLVLHGMTISVVNVLDELTAKVKSAPAITGTLDATWQPIADHAEDEAS